MKTSEFNDEIEKQIEKCRSLLIQKADEYAADRDRLHNFRVGAEIMHGDMKKVLAGFMLKHTISLYDMLGSDKSFPQDLWDEKITDHINYLLILQAVLADQDPEDEFQPPLFTTFEEAPNTDDQDFGAVIAKHTSDKIDFNPPFKNIER